MGHPVIVVEHDPAWARQFDELRHVLAATLGDVALKIELDNRAALPVVIDRLATLGYHHQGDGDVPGREAFGPGNGTCPVVEPPRTWPRNLETRTGPPVPE
ncbi:MAG: hypothetical protein JKY37_08695 [Nannocystaceae bacterium]|nr:hypothetical protein [Nannocystaceae bacterium]